VRLNRTSMAAGVVFAILAAVLVPLGSRGGLMGPFAAQAQNLGQRVVMGSVVDGSSAPVASATVFLKDLKLYNERQGPIPLRPGEYGRGS